MDVIRHGILLLALLVATGTGSACAGSQNRSGDSAAAQVQGDPPEEEPPDEMPEGPPVKVDGEVPDRREADAASESSEQSDESSEANRRKSPRDDRVYVREADVEALLKHGPGYIFQVIEVEPVETDGSFEGYRIVGAEEAARRYMQPQLQVGDLVTEVNGVPIERPDDYIAAWKKLKRKAVFEVEFVRDGTSQTARWVVRERAAAKTGDEGRGDGS